MSGIGNAGEADVITVLRNQCPESFTVSQSSKKGTTLFMTLAETDDRAANALVRLSGKISINNHRVMWRGAARQLTRRSCSSRKRCRRR